MTEIRTDANGRKYVYREESSTKLSELEALRAEVARLKEEYGKSQHNQAVLINDLTQRLAVANAKIDELQGGK